MVMKSDGYSAVKDQDFDVILTNTPIRAGKDVVHRIVEEAREYLKIGGALWVVIQKKQGAPSAWKKIEEVFSEVIKVNQDKGYWIIKAVK
ncbi:MAG: methyltransferase, partial [Bacilli bacterium]